MVIKGLGTSSKYYLGIFDKNLNMYGFWKDIYDLSDYFTSVWHKFTDII